MRRGQNSLRVAAILLMAAVMPVAAVAQDAKPKAKGEVVRLEVSAAAVPDPALRYTFLTPVAEQIVGPAAPLYLNGIAQLPERVTVGGKEQDFSELLSDEGQKPLAELKKADLSTVLIQSAAMDMFWYGSRRTRADWGATIREQGFEALLPYLNRIRFASNYLVVHGRDRLATDGDVSGALRDARIIFSMANHLREDAVVIQALVGMGVARGGLHYLVEEVIQQPGAPNLYWALANLPRPMYDMREAMGWERAAIRASLGPLRGGRSPEELSPGEWEQVTRDFSRMLLSASAQRNDPRQQVASTAFAVVFYPKAKQILIDAGQTPEAVGAMPAAQVLGTALLRSYDHWADEMAKWSGLPYWQAAPHLAALDKALADAKAKDPFNPTLSLVVTLDRTYKTEALLDRHVALVQTVEAIRAYAAGHDGAVPPSLDQLTDMPAPLDPMTGKAFEYSKTDDRTAEVSSPVPPVQRYVVTIRK